ncbi:MAG: NAD(+) synthetase, partial [Deltaproteobacteria bacterium]|nr:NAD(+) synthetase [Deltaproteobacteria bacterium]
MSQNQAPAISDWIREQVGRAGGSGAVFGLSGGVDSAVVAALCKEAT